MKRITIELTEDQVGHLLMLISQEIKDLHDYTDNEIEIAYATRLRHTLAKAKVKVT